jgi:shikimate dehydrogenase
MSFIKAAVIGHPVKHSKSPLIHHYWIKKYGLQGSYEAIDLAPENLERGLKDLIKEGYTGFNFTVPHKEAVMKLCDSVDLNAQSIGAVNTVAVEGKKLRGMNTDAYGFLTNITESTGGFSFGGKCAVVLGAGGAARAVIGGLMGAGIGKIILMNRTKGRALALASEMDMATGIIHVADWESRDDIMHEADLLVNTTSLGMNGQLPLEIDLKKLSARALVNDIVYAPLETQLLKDARALGATTVSGIGMLLHQARPAFKAWFGVMPEVTDELQELVLK